MTRQARHCQDRVACGRELGSMGCLKKITKKVVDTISHSTPLTSTFTALLLHGSRSSVSLPKAWCKISFTLCYLGKVASASLCRPQLLFMTFKVLSHASRGHDSHLCSSCINSCLGEERDHSCDDSLPCHVARCVTCSCDGGEKIKFHIWTSGTTYLEA
ncbi:hypothetical protein E2C01_047736 [Portunus trituberculatus]|uniref:Uncharacterized protein n=1 Tax=Portunus trituberculatus TaxID=210409 RepID=A0A5B7GBB8_PORTR|nr:hypothetical protein [Portunus trituberculatus]